MKFVCCLALPLGLLSAAPALAQGASDLPPACAAADPHAGHAMPGVEDGGHAMGGEAMPADASHRALMNSMKAMDGMEAAMTAPDVDVAFVCGMILHHRAAVAMAQAELAHGDDAWAKKLAQEIIAAQEREIAAMTGWLEKQPRP